MKGFGKPAGSTAELAPGSEKALTDRLNMGRLFIFNLFACAGVLLITALLYVLKIYVLPADFQNWAFLIFAACLGVSALMVYVTSVSRNTRLFDKVCYGYIGVVSAVMYTFAFRALNSTVSVIFFWMLMMILGLLPIMNLKSYFVLLTIEAVPAVLLVIERGYSTESILTMVSISVTSVFLSTATYRSTIRNLDYQLTLDKAVSQAETDPMTQLLNRRGLERRLEDVWPMCIRQNLCVAVLMIDIDNFKKYNDTFGHAEGDECIRKVTGAIRKCIKRRTDYGARVGGEEFCVLLTSIDPRQAVKWSLELKSMIDGLRIPHAKTNFNPYVSVSMGLACSMVTGEISFEQLREEADKSLYDAKFNGRARLYYRHRAFGVQENDKKKVAGE